MAFGFGKDNAALQESIQELRKEISDNKYMIRRLEKNYQDLESRLDTQRSIFQKLLVYLGLTIKYQEIPKDFDRISIVKKESEELKS